MASEDTLRAYRAVKAAEEQVSERRARCDALIASEIASGASYRALAADLECSIGMVQAAVQRAEKTKENEL